jgi:hypothetical protein
MSACDFDDEARPAYLDFTVGKGNEKAGLRLHVLHVKRRRARAQNHARDRVDALGVEISVIEVGHFEERSGGRGHCRSGNDATMRHQGDQDDDGRSQGRDERTKGPAAWTAPAADHLFVRAREQLGPGATMLELRWPPPGEAREHGPQLTNTRDSSHVSTGAITHVNQAKERTVDETFDGSALATIDTSKPKGDTSTIWNLDCTPR